MPDRCGRCCRVDRGRRRAGGPDCGRQRRGPHNHVRARTRERELAVRVALGARHVRIARMVTLEADRPRPRQSDWRRPPPCCRRSGRSSSASRSPHPWRPGRPVAESDGAARGPGRRCRHHRVRSFRWSCCGGRGPRSPSRVSCAALPARRAQANGGPSLIARSKWRRR